MLRHPHPHLLLALIATALSTPAAAAGPPVVTILGDSVTAGLGLPAAEALPAQLQVALTRRGVHAVVRGAGVSGDTSAGGLARVDFSVAPDTAVCVVELGANDYLQSLPPAETRRNLTAIVERLKRRHIAVVLGGAPHANRAAGAYGREAFALYAEVARREHVRLAADFFAGVVGQRSLEQADGLHPNAAGVQRIATKLAPIVAAALTGSG